MELMKQLAAKSLPDGKLMRTEIFRQIQALVTSDTTVIAETGDSWFKGMALKLPGGARRPLASYRALGTTRWRHTVVL